MADPMRDSGLDLIREYIPDSPVYTPEDEPSQYDILYVPASSVYPTPAYNPPTPEYIPSLITERSRNLDRSFRNIYIIPSFPTQEQHAHSVQNAWSRFTKLNQSYTC